MPLYVYQCKLCNSVAQVVRSIEDRNQVPSVEDGSEGQKQCIDPGEEHEWERQIGGAQVWIPPQHRATN